MSQGPASRPCTPGRRGLSRALGASYPTFHNRNTSEQATAMTLATTISTTRHRQTMPEKPRRAAMDEDVVLLTIDLLPALA
jgi:hypothetical protein